MKRDAYREALRQLPINNPTIEDVQSIAPHLSAEQIERHILGTKNDWVYIAVPSLRIRNAYMSICYYKENGGNAVLHTPNPGRTHLSYDPPGPKLNPYIFMDEAMAYAEANWPEALILDTWKGAARFYVADPSDLVDGNPSGQFVIYATFSRTCFELSHDHSDRQSMLLDSALMEMTLDPLIGEELLAGHPTWVSLNCSVCGSGLHLTKCPVCGSTFKDNKHRAGNSTPLPVKMIQLLQAAGHVFRIDPHRAYVREYAVLMAGRAGISEEEMDLQRTHQR